MAEAAHSDHAIKLVTLENGMRVALERLPYLHSASMGVWIRVGSAHEQAAEAGIAHFLEHLFFKGTETRTTRQIMEAVESRGGQLNAFTSREYTCLYAKVLESHVAAGIEILADITCNSTFNDLEKERNVILEEIASVEDTPDEFVFDLLSTYHWPDHPLGRAVSGTQESVSALGLEDVRRFYRQWYVPENMIFAIAGNFDEDRVLEQVKEVFGGMPAGAVDGGGTCPGFRPGAILAARDITQAHVTFAFPGPALGTPDRFICDLASNILGGGSTSRLFERIREDEGLAYAIYTFDSFYRHSGMMGIYAAVAPQNFNKTIDLTLEELKTFCETPVSEEELEMNREQLKGGMLMSLEGTFNRMSRMAKSLMYYGRVIPVDEVITRLDAVQPADIQNFARNTFTEATTALVVLGPESLVLPERIAP
ncbi:MAG: insulinase family protein [Candidatus Hydrogenedentes bacterium]|nr:insulinase family protein [Candidatus Hydrogenedentota bacterium]